VVVARDVARRRDEDAGLALERLLSAAVEEVGDVRVLLGLGGVELPEATGKSKSSRYRVMVVRSTPSPPSFSESCRVRSGRKLKKIAASFAGSSRGRPSSATGTMNSSVISRS